MQNIITLHDVKEVVRKWLYLKCLQVVDVILATVVANRLAGDPLWTMIVAVLPPL